MTEIESAAQMPTNDLVREVTRHLNEAIRRDMTFGVWFVAAVSNLARNGWTISQIVHECNRDQAGIINPGAVVRKRLIAKQDCPPPISLVRTFPVLPFCSDDCRTRAGWLEDQDGHVTGRCPCRNTT